jgi:hypothetical protein
MKLCPVDHLLYPAPLEAHELASLLHRVGVEYRAQWAKKVRGIRPEMTQKFNYHPLRITLGGTAQLEARLMIKFTLMLWKIIPIVMQVEPYTGLSLALGALNPAACERPTSLGYQMHYGLDLTLGLDKISVKLPVLPQLEVGGKILPWYSTLTLVSRTPMTKVPFKGCLQVRSQAGYLGPT